MSKTLDPREDARYLWLLYAQTARGADLTPTQSYILFTHCCFSCLLANHIHYNTVKQL